jgi:hemerythrin-like domain-containing protein
MLNEHDEGREYVKGMEEGISEGNTEKLIDNARGYCILLRNHIYKEDNVLYPMAEGALTDEQKDMVNKKYLEVERILKAEMDIDALKFIK